MLLVPTPPSRARPPPSRARLGFQTSVSPQLKHMMIWPGMECIIEKKCKANRGLYKPGPLLYRRRLRPQNAKADKEDAGSTPSRSGCSSVLPQAFAPHTCVLNKLCARSRPVAKHANHAFHFNVQRDLQLTTRSTTCATIPPPPDTRDCHVKLTISEQPHTDFQAPADECAYR